MHRIALHFAALLSLALPVDAQTRLDMIPSLATAEVCPGGTDACWPDAVSTNLHRSEPGTVALPARTTTNLYLRVPPDGRLAIEFVCQNATFGIVVRTDDRPAAELYRSPAADGGWLSVEVDLGTLAGELAVLGLRAEPAPGSGTGRVLVRRATVLGRDVPSPVSTAPLAARPNIVVYLIDTLRADHLGCYGYPRPTSPRIDAFARSAIRFTRALAESSWTLPTTASLLTGLLPPHHGAIARDHAIRPDVPTLPGLLRAGGYQTAAFVTNYLGADFGQRRDFETFHFYPEADPRRPEVFLPSSAVYRRVARWVERRVRPPFFLYVHASDPHFPYRPPPRYLRPFGRPRAELEATLLRARPLYMRAGGPRPTPLSAEDVTLLTDGYDGDVRLADDFFGRLIDLLAARGILDETLVVLTADHGEEFRDHGGVAHGQTLYQESLRVPLLLRLPGGVGGGTEVDVIAQHTDLLPTILAAAGLPSPPGVDGRPLLSAAREEPEAYASMAVAGRRLEALASARWKVIHNLANPGQPRFEVYDLAADPAERQNVTTNSSVRRGYARGRLAAVTAAGSVGPTTSAEQRSRLEALGYVGD